jgi:hypothetical protein
VNSKNLNIMNILNSQQKQQLFLSFYGRSMEMKNFESIYNETTQILQLAKKENEIDLEILKNIELRIFKMQTLIKRVRQIDNLLHDVWVSLTNLSKPQIETIENTVFEKEKMVELFFSALLKTKPVLKRSIQRIDLYIVLFYLEELYKFICEEEQCRPYLSISELKQLGEEKNIV